MAPFENLSVGRLAVSLLLCGFVCAGLLAQTPAAPPNLSVDLGGSELYGQFLKSHTRRVPPVQLAFITQSRVAISFFVFGERSHSSPDHATLVSIFVNLNSKTIEKTLTWIMPYSSAFPLEQRWLLPSREGEFVVYTGDRLLRYGADFQILQERAVPDPNRTQILISPGRSLLLVSEFVRPGKFRESVLSTSDFKTERLVGEVEQHSSGISDDGEVLRLSVHDKGSSKRVVACVQYRKDDYEKTCGQAGVAVEGFDSQICTPGGCAPLNTPLSRATVVNEGLLLVDTFERPLQQSIKAEWRLALLQRTGEVLYRAPDKNNEGPHPGFVSTAISLPRFSVSTAHIGFSKSGIDWVQDIHVFDIRQMHMTLDLHFVGHGASQFRPLDAAISPDGTNLAVLPHTALELYGVP